MDRNYLLHQLAQFERHVQEGAAHLSHQQDIICRLEAGGHDTSPALRLLRTFEESQKLHVADRDRVAAELAALQ